ncbi:MAG TPA: SRPBCC family protein [Nostocaceae cyanobacterium]|nr:SRPBCC family protein [Nostocaceae cyanobacterium]
MLIKTNAQIIINENIESVFDISTDCENLPKFFTGYQPIPAIVNAKTLDELPLHEGSTRIVNNSDGSSVEEILVQLERPHVQAYKLIKGLKPPFSFLVRSAQGKWIYTNTDSGVKVDWEFEFEISNILGYLIFNLAVKKPFQKAQEICLENIKKYIEGV